MVVGDRLGDLLGRAVADEHRLLAPGDGDFLTERHLAQIVFDGGQGQGVGRRIELVDQGPGHGGDAADGGGDGRRCG